MNLKEVSQWIMSHQEEHDRIVKAGPYKPDPEIKSQEVMKELVLDKECLTCGTLKESNPTPDGDEICLSCGDREMMDKECDKIRKLGGFTDRNGETDFEAIKEWYETKIKDFISQELKNSYDDGYLKGCKEGVAEWKRMKNHCKEIRKDFPKE